MNVVDLPTCEQARDAYVDELGKHKGEPADLQVTDFASVLNNGSYLDACNVPHATAIEICAAVQNGEVKGITVKASPGDATLERCVAGAVVGLSFPEHPRLDLVRTKFAPQNDEAPPVSDDGGSSTASDPGTSSAPPRVPPKSGCGCSTAPSSEARLVWVPLALALLARRARRRP